MRIIENVAGKVFLKTALFSKGVVLVYRTLQRIERAAQSFLENLARNPQITSAVSEWRPPTPLDPAGAVFYISLVIVVGLIAYRLRSDRGRKPADGQLGRRAVQLGHLEAACANRLGRIARAGGGSQLIVQKRQR